MTLVIVLLLLTAHEGARLLTEKLLGLPVKLVRLTVAPGPRGKRVAVAMASIAASYLALGGVSIYHHKQYGVRTGNALEVVAGIDPEFDAHGKLQVGDAIRSVDDIPAYYMRDGERGPPLSQTIQERMATGVEAVTIEVERAGQRQIVFIAPRWDDSRDPPFYRLGIQVELRFDRESGSIGDALLLPVSVVSEMFSAMFRPMEERLQGPVGIARTMATTSDPGLTLRALIIQGVYFFLFVLLPWLVLRLISALSRKPV